MPERLPIHDLFIRPLQLETTTEGSALTVLRYSDHLLRRFGLAEVLLLEADQERSTSTRQVADEVWALVRGAAEFEWQDLREDSPTCDQYYRIRCDRPTLVLAPFGVAFGIRSVDGPAEFIRLATHEDEGSS